MVGGRRGSPQGVSAAVAAPHLRGGPAAFVVGVNTGGDPAAGEVGEVLHARASEAQPFFHLLRSAAQQLVEDVERLLAAGAGHDAALLEQVVGDGGASQLAADGEVGLHKLPKAGGVVVTCGGCVAEGLQQRVALQNAGGKASGLVHSGAAERPSSCGRAHGGQVPQHVLGRLRLAGAGFTADDDGLVAPLAEHVAQRVLGHCEAVWLRRAEVSVVVAARRLHRVERQRLEGVGHQQEAWRARVDHIALEAGTHSVQHRGVVEVDQGIDVADPVFLPWRGGTGQQAGGLLVAVQGHCVRSPARGDHAHLCVRGLGHGSRDPSLGGRQERVGARQKAEWIRALRCGARLDAAGRRTAVTPPCYPAAIRGRLRPTYERQIRGLIFLDFPL